MPGDRAVLGDGTPKVPPNVVDADEGFVEEPPITGVGAAATQPVRVGLPKLGVPAPDRLVRGRHPVFDHHPPPRRGNSA